MDLSPIEFVRCLCFDNKGRILVTQEGGDGWGIPGGHPEAGETPEQAVAREVWEEACVVIGAPTPIDWQLGEWLDQPERREGYCVRFAATAEEMLPMRPDPATGRMFSREFVTPDEFRQRIHWGQSGEAMRERALRWWRGATALTHNVREYYAARTPEYDKTAGYLDPESEKARAPIKARFQRLFAEHDVLEIACGTGYWTKVIAATARSVLATDVNPAILELARKRLAGAQNVQFRVADAYTLAGVPDGFTAAFAIWWWSHVPKAQPPAVPLGPAQQADPRRARALGGPASVRLGQQAALR